MLEGHKFTAQPARSQGFNDPMMSGSIVIIPIHGTLIKRSTGMDALSGLTSYETIQAQMRSAINAGAAGILFDFDSPGGEVNGMLELSDEIFQARKQLPIWASANDMAASAGYALASAAGQVFITRVGIVGSVGIIALHRDQSGFDEQAGLNYEYVYAGARKIDGNPHQPLSDRARADLQSDVDKVYKLLVATVARNRGLTEKAIRDTQAAISLGEDAVKQRLADQVASFDEVVGLFSDRIVDGPQASVTAETRVEGRKLETAAEVFARRRSVKGFKLTCGEPMKVPRFGRPRPHMFARQKVQVAQQPAQGIAPSLRWIDGYFDAHPDARSL